MLGETELRGPRALTGPSNSRVLVTVLDEALVIIFDDA